MNLPEVREVAWCEVRAIVDGAVALFGGNESRDVDRQGCWEHNVSVCLARGCGYRATVDGPEFMDNGCSGGKGAHSIDSRRRSDV